MPSICRLINDSCKADLNDLKFPVLRTDCLHEVRGGLLRITYQADRIESEYPNSTYSRVSVNEIMAGV